MKQSSFSPTVHLIFSCNINAWNLLKITPTTIIIFLKKAIHRKTKSGIKYSKHYLGLLLTSMTNIQFFFSFLYIFPNFPNYACYVKIYFSYYKIHRFFSVFNFLFLLTFAFWWRNTVLWSKLLAWICQGIYQDSWTLLFHFTKSKREQQTLFINAFLYSFTAMFHKYSGIHLAIFILFLIKYI